MRARAAILVSCVTGVLGCGTGGQGETSVDGPSEDAGAPAVDATVDATATDGAADATIPVDATLSTGAGAAGDDAAITPDASDASEAGEAGEAGEGGDASLAPVDSGGDSTSPSDDDSGTPPEAGDAGPAPVGVPVLQFHMHATRDGVYVDPLLTAANAAKMHRDTTFAPSLSGHVYAQPLYVPDGPGDAGAFYVATEGNDVYAIDETGGSIWTTNVGSNASGAEKCGNIQPLGITGTPAIDPSRRAIYLDAARPGSNATTLGEHEIHALSIDTGEELAGWPVVASTVGVLGGGAAFDPKPQNQRGALLVAGTMLYVPYGGHSGDCTDNEGDPYHGWVIAVPLDAPSMATAWSTASEMAGIWSVGGLSSDGTSIFGATGNGPTGQTCPEASIAEWMQQEAVLRFTVGGAWSGLTTDYFAPASWPCLDNGDVDLGGSDPVLVDLPGSTPSQLATAMGKDGKAYLLDRTNLGGIAGSLSSLALTSGQFKMAPTVYTTVLATYLVGYASGAGVGTSCTQGSGNLVAATIVPGSPPSLAPSWCANEQGQGSPIFTTSDGVNDPLVWAIGAEQSDQLRAWNADTGAVVFDGGTSADVATGFRHISTILAVKGRIFAAADGALYAYTSQ